MSIDYNSLLKNFQSVIVSYQDVSAIYSKLFSQGQLQKLAGLLTEIYDEEHFFTLTELQKFCRDNNQKEDEFVAEQYELNSNIFRRNLTLITQNLVEEIGKKFLEKFRVEFSGSETLEEGSTRQASNAEQPQYMEQTHNVEPLVIELPLEKSYYKSHMPEIREENETIAATPINKAVPKFLEPEDHEPHFTTSQTYESNVSESIQKLQPQQEGSLVNSSPAQKQAQEVNTLKAVPRVSPMASSQDDPYKHIPAAFIKSEVSTLSANGSDRIEEAGRYSHGRLSQSRANRGRLSASPVDSQPNHHWSSPERVAALARGAPHSAHLTRGPPLSAKSAERRNLSMMGISSFSGWSMSNGRPDPSILDSEFSYGQGTSFSKSPKKFHHDISKVPGPGNYEADATTTQIKNIQHSFVKSQKVPSYFRKSEVPGAIYYPVRHFLSK